MSIQARPRLTLLRPHKTRAIRSDAGSCALETIAAEFALLAQRRARIARQVDLLDRQLAAAEASLTQVTDRMARLASRMECGDPALREAAAPPPPPPPPPPPVVSSRLRLAARPSSGLVRRRLGPFTA
jgi:uncharacterized coiled-coil protein SlyX